MHIHGVQVVSRQLLYVESQMVVKQHHARQPVQLYGQPYMHRMEVHVLL